MKPPSLLTPLSHRRVAMGYEDPKNLVTSSDGARRPGRRTLAKVMNSIGTFGFCSAVVVDRQNNVVIGNLRVEAAKALGLPEIPVLYIEDLSPAQIRALQVADNRLGELGKWDTALLKEIILELKAAEIDLDLTGFEGAEIDSFMVEPIDAEERADRLPAPAKAVISKEGDIWQLDNHRVICGDARHGDTYKQLMQGATAAAAFTDPPYNVAIEGHVSGLGAIKHTAFAMGCGEMSDVQFADFLKTVMSHMVAHSAAGATHFVCMDWRHIRELSSAGQAIYPVCRNICVWVKDNGGMGSLYRSRHELVFVFATAGTAQNNVQLGRFDRNRTNVWEYAGMSGAGRRTEEGDLLALHPTVKPVAMVADAILDVTIRGDIVLDPFLGSGTTVIAAERTGRMAYGIEYDPRYVDTIVRRWQAYTGGKAILAATGVAFDDLAKEVAHGC